MKKTTKKTYTYAFVPQPKPTFAGLFQDLVRSTAQSPEPMGYIDKTDPLGRDL